MRRRSTIAPRRLLRALALRACAGVALCTVIGACKGDPEGFSIAVSGGLDGAAFAGDPTVARVELRVRAVDGTERVIARAATTAGGVDLPDGEKTGIGALVLAGLGADGATLVYGRTPAIELSGLTTAPTTTLAILAQRTGSITRALELPAIPVVPRCTTLGTRYVIVADGTTAHVVDLLSLTARSEVEAWTTAPVTLATAGVASLAIDAAGVGTLVDFDAGTSSAATPPSGTTFADVVGGTVVPGEEGSVYVVGATRAASKTDVVLRLATDGTLSAKRLLRARTGAAAAWVEGRGLVVAYGESDAETSIEILAPGATASVALAFPPKNARAGVLASIGTSEGSRLLRVADDGTATFIDLACASACMETLAPFRDDLPSSREDDHAIALEGGGAVLVRSGHVAHLPKTVDRLLPLFDGKTAVCSARLATGNVALAFAGDRALRTVSPARP